jgi:uncharacterized protein YqjF (DUF2071 family)
MGCLRRTAARAAGTAGRVADGADLVVAALPGAARRQRASLRHTAHRPWPLPDGRWLMGQTWADLLFAHWPVAAERMRALVPRALELDLFDGGAWLTVTPFEARGTRPRGALPPPLLSCFPELNVRTYVTFGGQPGIWFFSLDAASAAAVVAARAAYRLPYFTARIRIGRADEPWVDYRSERTDARGAPARFEARYRPAGRVRQAPAGTLEAWLVERYRLYTVDGRGRLYSADIHHRPWTLEDAYVDLRANTMAAPLGLDLAGPPLTQFARRQDVVFWPLRPAGEAD